VKIGQGTGNMRTVFRELGKYDKNKRSDGALSPGGLHVGLGAPGAAARSERRRRPLGWPLTPCRGALQPSTCGSS
jgi:hypothetical protein